MVKSDTTHPKIVFCIKTIPFIIQYSKNNAEGSVSHEENIHGRGDVPALGRGRDSAFLLFADGGACMRRSPASDCCGTALP